MQVVAEQIRELVTGPRPGQLYPPDLKKPLVETLGARDAAAAWAEMAGFGAGWTAMPVEITGLDVYAAAHASERTVLAPSRDLTLPLPEMFGPCEPSGPPVEAVSREFFFCRLDDIVVSARSSVLLTADRALIDAEAAERSRLPLTHDVDPVIFGASNDSAVALVGAGGDADPLPTAFPMVGVHSYNFGHWLIEYVPKLLAALDRPGFSTVPIVIDDEMPPQHLEIVRLLCGADQPIVTLEPRECVRVAELWTCSSLAYLPAAAQRGATLPPDLIAVDPDQAAALIGRAVAAIGGRAQPRPEDPERIYLKRQPSQSVKLVNQAEVEGLVTEAGFEVLDFGTLPFVDQVRLVRSAQCIVGQDGSAMMMALFARPGTSVGVLTNPFAELNEWFTLVCRELGLRYSVLCGELAHRNPNYRKFSDYRIAPVYLERLLSTLSARGMPGSA